jgi:hypothetical protein
LFGIAESGLLLSNFSVGANRTAPRRRAMWFTLRPMFRAALAWMNRKFSGMSAQPANDMRRHWEMTKLMSDREVAAAAQRQLLCENEACDASIICCESAFETIGR